MPECDQVKLLLGPFDDGELEPHEMEDVAFHVVTCGGCKAALNEYRSLGVALRDCLPQPSIAGFAASVLEQIDDIRQPWWIRLRSYLESLGERVGGTVPLVAAGAFAALLTVWLVTPYAQHTLHRSSNPSEVASRSQNEMAEPPPTAATTLTTVPDQAGSSMLALSDDPTTTVIWLPNQP
jgi:anti-sigma factor RsiW